MLVTSAAFLGGSLLLSACGKVADDHTRTLRVSVTGKGEGDMRLLFRSAGISPKDFTLDYSDFQSGHLVVEALNGGSLDFGGMSEIPPVFAAASTIQSFRQIGIMHGDVNNQVILLPKDSPIKDLKGLEGKRVGFVRATTSHYFLIRMLESVGLSWSDITPVAMGVSDGAAAFSRGSLDAWAIYGFPIQRSIATEGARVLKTASGFLSGNYLVSAHVDALADPAKSALVGEYLTLLRRGFVWSNAHLDKWTTIVAKDIGVPRDYVADQFKHRSDPFELRPVSQAAIQSQQEVANVFAKAGLIPKAVDVRPLWDDRFTAVIEKEL
jgi:sulfonate transport system substrate-binding protein